ncbi:MULTISPECIES: SusC/RagA family TonB-linked outer membrane protein [unclassified Flavobacterium]|uniref:SusC/RagA family TonB-linked outer membrane protein n=1 Tax=unclassified Flavobacterium TaxID=196869 RepID=UPI000EAC1F81|nr:MULTISPECIES: SusC/RagA family TonB-linked outer membrane protein [unclassified Flavobacterium]RKS00525.1 TonB-linked SusC/RagA family outer membrane protein [Flavobacterium sp. 102]
MRSKFKWIFTLLLALSMQFSFAQEKTVTGVVSDKTGPLPGANVVVKGTTRSAQADFDGKFSITAKAGEVLVISFTGYNNSSVTVGAANNYVVTLTDGIKLDEVVVEGYRNTTKGTTVVAQTTVNAKTIENRPNASFIQTLQGQVAGLNITSGTGQPGAASSVVIRGAGSLTGNTDPLYVIDGIPTNAINFRSINPTDIESVTVLKDAAATAIYGNRGSGGVIIVKTKRGGTGDAKTSFRYSSTTGYTELQKAKYSFADSRELLTLEKRYGVGRGNSLTDDEIAAYGINTDWVNYFFSQAKSTDHQLSIETSGKNLNSYTSVSYLDQEGILQNTGLKRFTLRNNLSGKSNNDKFTYSLNTSLGFSKSQQAVSLGTGSINQNYVLGATLGAPYISPDEYVSSQQVFDLYNTDGTLLYTPLFLIDKANTFSNDTDEVRMSAGVDLGYNLFKNVTARSRTSFENIETRIVQWQHPISFNSFLFLNPGQEFGGTESIAFRREFRFNQLWQVEWKKTFAEKHTVTALGNAEYYGSQVNTDFQNQRGLDPRTFVPGTGAGYLADITAHDFYGPTGNASKIKYALLSYFGVLDYDFNDRLGVVGTVRYDGTNRFAEDYYWGTFWSVAGRWNINKEKFMENSGFQVLKLRASYGTTGNERIQAGTEWTSLQPPLTRDTYANSATVPGQYNGAASYAVTLGVDDLRWETTTQWNVGIDFEFFKNRVRGTLDYYNRLTVDLLNTEPISPITGQTLINRNSDIELTNKGFELSLAYDVVRNENFKFTVRGNVSKNNTTVNGIPEAQGGEQNLGLTINRNGLQPYEFYLYPYAGVNPDNGNLLFEAADGTLTETPSIADDSRATGKTSTPIYQGGFGFDLDYKGFFASTNFTFVQDVYRFDYDLQGLYDPGSLGQFVVSDDLLNAWTPTNTDTNVPSLNATNYGAEANSDRFLKDASYVRLRYLQVGYRVPKKFLDKTFITGLSFYVQGENLYTWTKWEGLDAESNRGNDQAQYPTPRIFSFGVDLKF